MIVERNLSRFCVFAEDSVLRALQKISENKSRIVFSVTEHGRLEGVITDGDIRRWLMSGAEFDLNAPVSSVSNSEYVCADPNAPLENIRALFSERIEFIPLVDSQNHLVAFARLAAREIVIGDHIIGPNQPAFLIAEIGNNHNGDLGRAKHLIDLAAESGADCAKFQMRDMETLYANRGNPNDAAQDLGSQYTLDLLSRFNLDRDSLFEAFEHCKTQGLIPLCTPWDLRSVMALEEYGIEAYKVASADLTNNELLQAIARIGKPILLSTGMSHETEILETIELLRRSGVAFVPLHCNSTYPTPFKDVNLNYLDRLKEFVDGPVGYSGHERGYQVAVAAVAKGANVIEKHFTLDRDMEGNDHKVSLLPQEFAEMVAAIRVVEESLGVSQSRTLSQGELMNREMLGKSLVAVKDIAIGEEILNEWIIVQSPGRGLQPNRRTDLIGRRARRPISSGEFFYPSDLGEGVVEPHVYQFRRPWGVPVRYHDFSKFVSRVEPDLFEFHLSYKDLNHDLENFFPEPISRQLLVHSPELFAGDHVLDLVADDKTWRQESAKNLERVVNITRSLNKWFPKTDRPQIIVNVGGFTQNQPLSVKDREMRYERLGDILTSLDVEGVEILPQTMPPFPWHFGGQRFHNLFVIPAEVDVFCRNTGLRVCFDVSHSALACNHLGLSMSECVHLIGPHTAHLHLADADGVDGEGLQIGDGTIDFPALAKGLDEYAQEASFIPEIWQGHKDQGSGFWLALEKLETWF